MNRFLVSTIILLSSVLFLVCISRGAEGQTSRSEAESKMMMRLIESLQSATAEPPITIDPNAKADPNVPKSKEDEELDRTMRRLERLSRDEVLEWTENNGDNKLDLAKAVNKQVEDELKFLRRIAREEGCGKTADVINRLIILRRERFKQYTKEMEKTDTRQRRITERSERDESIEPLRRSRSSDSDLEGMSREERRRAWEERRRSERERRVQERNERRRSQQVDEYPMPNP
jgi:hypothetical protein